MKRYRRPKCKHCGKLYKLNPHRGSLHKYCSKPECQKASRTASQRRWLAKPENKTHFCGPENVLRVQEWRKANPGYWRRRKKRPSALQDVSPAQPVVIKGDAEVKQRCAICLIQGALQDVSATQQPLLVGLISSLTGFTLQDEIAQSMREIQTRGELILGKVPGMESQRGEKHDRETRVV